MEGADATVGNQGADGLKFCGAEMGVLLLARRGRRLADLLLDVDIVNVKPGCGAVYPARVICFPRDQPYQIYRSNRSTYAVDMNCTI